MLIGRTYFCLVDPISVKFEQLSTLAPDYMLLTILRLMFVENKLNRCQVGKTCRSPLFCEEDSNSMCSTQGTTAKLYIISFREWFWKWFNVDTRYRTKVFFHYHGNRTAPLSLMARHSKRAPEIGCNVQWLLGSSHVKQQCAGLCSHWIPN